MNVLAKSDKSKAQLSPTHCQLTCMKQTRQFSSVSLVVSAHNDSHTLWGRQQEAWLANVEDRRKFFIISSHKQMKYIRIKIFATRHLSTSSATGKHANRKSRLTRTRSRCHHSFVLAASKMTKVIVTFVLWLLIHCPLGQRVKHGKNE
jgi:hypothetical protein